MTAQPSSQAEREDVAREVLAEAYDAANLPCVAADVRSGNDITWVREKVALAAIRKALSDREHATPRSMPEEVVAALRNALTDLDDARSYNRTEEAYGRIAEAARKIVAEADTCDHEWYEVDSMFTNEYKTNVHCLKCHCSGERDESDGSIYWPAT